MVAQGSFSYFGATAGYASFVEYRGLARDSNLAGRVQANLLMVRLSAVKYLQQQSVSNEQEYTRRLALLENLLKQARSEINNGQRARLVQEAVVEVKAYEVAFDKIKKLYVERHTLVKNTLDPTGGLLRETMAEVMDSAYKDQDTSASYYAAQVSQALLLARLYVTKYLVTNNMNDYQRALQEFTRLEQLLTTLTKQIESPERINLLNTFKKHKQLYLQGLRDIKEVVGSRNTLIMNVLDKAGPSAADKLEQVKLSVKNDQDMLGPQVENSASNTVYSIITFSLLAIVIGIFLSFFMTRVITKPIGGEPKDIATLARKIADGDLTGSFNSNKENTGIALALADMQISLKAIISEVSQGAVQINHDVSRLNEITSRSQLGAQSQMDELNMSSVAMEQLTKTVEEITANAHQAAENTQETSDKAILGQEQVLASTAAISDLLSNLAVVSQSIEALHTQSDNVGTILDVIRGIADQTNLLALNAAIEAARAGEQGRGFAVVADEVRTLASRTQQSTEEIQTMISSLQNEAQAAVTSMAENSSYAEKTTEKSQQVKDILSEISTAVAQIRDMNEQTAQASTEQSQATSHIAETIECVNQKAVAAAADAQQAAEAANELDQLASNLKFVVSKFKL